MSPYPLILRQCASYFQRSVSVVETYLKAKCILQLVKQWIKRTDNYIINGTII